MVRRRRILGRGCGGTMCPCWRRRVAPWGPGGRAERVRWRNATGAGLAGARLVGGVNAVFMTVGGSRVSGRETWRRRAAASRLPAENARMRRHALAIDAARRDDAGRRGLRARGGKGVSPFRSLRRRLAREGRRAQQTNAPAPTGGERRKGGNVQGSVALPTWGGCGCEERAPPRPSNAPAPRGPGARGTSAGVSRPTRRAAARGPAGKGVPAD